MGRAYDRALEDLPMLSDHPVFPILLSTDLDASRTFYRDTLGLEITPRGSRPDRLPVRRRDAARHHREHRRDLGHADADGMARPGHGGGPGDLRARGVRIEEYEAPDPVTTDGVADMGHSWAAWFIDPSRNVLAVVQPKG